MAARFTGAPEARTSASRAPQSASWPPPALRKGTMAARGERKAPRATPIPAWAMAGPASMPTLGLASWPRTCNGAITRTSRGFLGWPLSVRLMVSLSRLTVPWPS